MDRAGAGTGTELGCAPGRPLKDAHARLLTNTAATGAPTEYRGPIRTYADPRPAVPRHAEQEIERLRILIVDDHTTFSDLLAGALDREPDLQSVGAAKTVEDALPLFREVHPDVVILDLYLPDGSGLKAAERILSEAPETKIVMLTGNPSQEALREAARMGICGFLPKDGSLGTLLDTLRHARAGNMIVHPSLIAGFGTTAAPAAKPAGM